MAQQFTRSQFALPLLAAGALIAVGCGRGTDVAERNPAGQPADQRQASPLPEDVVSQFLDRVRRGGDANAAGQLLTRRAQAELERIGRSVQPIGSPDARFQVTRSESVPGDPQAVLVHSLWSEPNSQGSMDAYQVVWALERDPEQWRISGLAMELAPGSDPEIIDFENGAMMARLLTAAEAPGSDNPSQAATPATNLSR